MTLRTFLLWVLLCVPALGQAEAPKILVLGDSLSAGYGIPVQQGWVTLMQQRLAAKGYPHKVINASISGDTTRGGLSRLPAALRTYQPKIVLIELGANDGLRGQPLAQMRANLEQMLDLTDSIGAKAAIFEMYIPSSYGPDYTKQFTASFSAIGKARKVPVVPFFLGAFATDAKAFQDDGIHPTAASQPKMLDAVWPTLVKLLK